MTTVKFDKSVKYRGVRYAAHEAFKVQDEDVAELKKVGATVLSVDTPHSEPEGEGETGNQEEDSAGGEDIAELKEALLGYTVAQLTQLAKERNIDLQGKTKRADIYNIIVASLN